MHSEPTGNSGERLVLTGVGIAPVIALANSLIVGLAFAVLLVTIAFATRTIVFLFRSVISPAQRSAYALLVAAAVTGVVQMLIDLWLPGLSYNLGVFLPLLAVHTLVIENHSIFQNDRTFGGVLAAIAPEVFLLAGLLLAFSTVRELLGTGHLTLWQEFAATKRLAIPLLVDNPLSVLGYAATGFIGLGIVIAFLRSGRES